ncbi:hypothetical protein AAY473_020980 [Plecturocebus cupreus]
MLWAMRKREELQPFGELRPRGSRSQGCDILFGTLVSGISKLLGTTTFPSSRYRCLLQKPLVVHLIQPQACTELVPVPVPGSLQQLTCLVVHSDWTLHSLAHTPLTRSHIPLHAWLTLGRWSRFCGEDKKISVGAECVAHAYNPSTLRGRDGRITCGQEFKTSLANMVSQSGIAVLPLCTLAMDKALPLCYKVEILKLCWVKSLYERKSGAPWLRCSKTWRSGGQARRALSWPNPMLSPTSPHMWVTPEILNHEYQMKVKTGDKCTQTRFHHVGQAGLELLTSGDPPTSASLCWDYRCQPPRPAIVAIF